MARRIFLLRLASGGLVLPDLVTLGVALRAGASIRLRVRARIVAGVFLLVIRSRSVVRLRLA
jgi:hypothetical protein